MNSNEYDNIPDVRDGLTRNERVVLYCLDQLQKERDGSDVPTAMHYGRVIEYLEMSIDELQAVLTNIGDRIRS